MEKENHQLKSASRDQNETDTFVPESCKKGFRSKR